MLGYKGGTPAGQVYKGKEAERLGGEPPSHALGWPGPLGGGFLTLRWGGGAPETLFKLWWAGGLKSDQRPWGPPQLGPKVWRKERHILILKSIPCLSEIQISPGSLHFYFLNSAVFGLAPWTCTALRVSETTLAPRAQALWGPLPEEASPFLHFHAPPSPQCG